MTESSSASTWKDFRRLMRVLPHRWVFVFAIIMTVIISGMQILFSHLLRQTMDSAVQKDLTGLGRAALFLAVLALCESAVRAARTAALGFYEARGVASIRQRASERLASLPMGLAEREHSGDYLSRLTNDAARLSDLLMRDLVRAIYLPLASVGAFIYLAFLNWRLAVVCTLTGPLIIVISSMVSRPIATHSRETQERLGEAASVVQDSIAGAEVARVFGFNRFLQQKYDRAVDESVREAKKTAKGEAILLGVCYGGGNIPYVLLFAIGGYWVVNGRMTPGSLIAFIQLMNYLTSPMSDIPNIIGAVRKDLAAAVRVLDLLELPSERDSSPSADTERWVLPGNVSSGIVVSCRKLSFCYPSRDEPVLRGLDLEIGLGEVVAVVGPSGCGKSTLVKLILGFYETYQGDLEVFGRPVSQWNLKELRNLITVVQQDPYLFPGSIGENIGLGKQGATREEIVTAAKAAHIHDFIEGLPQGYDTEVGELGGRLSGGEKQRIAIARALLKGSPLVILDEATSFLDNESERHVLEALDSFTKDRTCIIIAHRLSSIRQVKRVLVMDGGVVVESGSPEELLERDGLYAKLYREQSGEVSAK